jgi:hypothetical protein
MFGSARPAPKPQFRREQRVRGIATLRLFNPSDYPWGTVYEEAVVGGYKNMAERSAVILVSHAADKPCQQFKVSSGTGFARHLGVVPEKIHGMYEQTPEGGSFHLRSARCVRMTKEEIRSLVFSQPIWYAEKQVSAALAGKAPLIPGGAKMAHRSVFSNEAGEVSAILAASDAPDQEAESLDQDELPSPVF